MPSNRKVRGLLRRYSEIPFELQRLRVIRSQNVTGDYGEYVARRKCHLTLSAKGAKGYDATDGRGYKYQIKSRRITRKNKAEQLGVIRELNFDYLLAVIFGEDYSSSEVYKIPKNKLLKLQYNKRQNGYILRSLKPFRKFRQ